MELHEPMNDPTTNMGREEGTHWNGVAFVNDRYQTTKDIVPKTRDGRMLPLVYMAGPYTQGDQATNVRCQIALFHELMDDGVVMPYAPLLSHFSQFIRLRSWEDWMEHSYVMLLASRALIRFPASDLSSGYLQWDSKGADLEEEFCRQQGIPAFRDKESLYQHFTRKSV